MSGLLKIGIVGCGAIGSSLAERILSDFRKEAELVGLYDIQIQNVYKLANRFNNMKLVVLNLDDLINKSDLVIEATKAESSLEIAKKTLSLSRDIMIMSVGGIIEHYLELEALAKEKKAHIYIPSGAICGIDGLKATACGRIDSITLITKKPPSSFLGVPYVIKRKIRLDSLTEPTVIFEGDAFSAIRAFPQNINVCATLSIAGIGPYKTKVKIIADPTLKHNIHQIEIESDTGKIITYSENVIHPDNPKTSYLAVLSAVATLKGVFTAIKIGT
ncbi:MAG: aspartate dehydrogenase [Candidatus Omnitrophica bacterium]|nr:aspartate dehydrogenase [Candidatus Omnitrophota bacterium]